MWMLYKTGMQTCSACLPMILNHAAYQAKTNVCSSTGWKPSCTPGSGTPQLVAALTDEEAQRDFITPFQYLKGSQKEDGGPPFTRSHMEERRGNGYKLHWERFNLNVIKKFFTVRTITHWNNLPRNMVEFLSPDVLKTRLHRALGSLSHKRLDQMIFGGPLLRNTEPGCSTTSWN